jgi:UDP-N-acetylglucosamine 3-dehydrogenase
LLGVLRFTNQAIGILDVNWLTPTKVRELSITGEKGMYLINYLTQDVFFYENDYTTTDWDTLRTLTGVSEGTMTRLKIPKAEPLRLEYESVINAIGHGCVGVGSNRADEEHHALAGFVRPIVSGKDGLAVLRIALQMGEMASGDMVKGTQANVRRSDLKIGVEI